MSHVHRALTSGVPTGPLTYYCTPRPTRCCFWDMVVLNGYLFLNIVVGWTVLEAEAESAPPPKWVKPSFILSIPWAVSIHTVTAFLVRWSAWTRLLVERDHGPQIFRVGVCSRSCAVDYDLSIFEKYTKFDAGWELYNRWPRS